MNLETLVWSEGQSQHVSLSVFLMLNSVLSMYNRRLQLVISCEDSEIANNCKKPDSSKALNSESKGYKIGWQPENKGALNSKSKGYKIGWQPENEGALNSKSKGYKIGWQPENEGALNSESKGCNRKHSW